jgi:hypothetical protein
MAGFEVVVRPVVFPNIRPSRARTALASSDDPEQGKCVLIGGGAKFMGASYNWSVSLSRQLPRTETARQFDKERVYKTDKDGTVDKSTFIDLERLKKVRLDRGEEVPIRDEYADPPKADNIETLETDVVRNEARSAWISHPGGSPT